MTKWLKTCSRCCLEKSLIDDFFDDDRGDFWCKQCAFDFLVAHRDEKAYRDSAEFVPPAIRGKGRRGHWTAHRALVYLAGEIGGLAVPGGSHGVRVCDDCGDKFGGKDALAKHKTLEGCWTGRQTVRLKKDEKGIWRNLAPTR